MIRIVKGVYGHKVGQTIKPVSSKDGPLELSPEKEERLVKIGVAVYVNEQVEQKSPAQTQKDLELPKYNKRMKLDELKEVAKAYKVDASDCERKADVIKMIEGSKKTHERLKAPPVDNSDDEDLDPDVIDDGDTPPELDAADPVE